MGDNAALVMLPWIHALGSQAHSAAVKQRYAAFAPLFNGLNAGPLDVAIDHVWNKVILVEMGWRQKGQAVCSLEHVLQV